MISSMNTFCDIDPERCTIPVVLSNIWWHTPVISALSLRISIAFIEIMVFAGRRTSDGNAGKETEDTLYDIGEDFGSILRYILDFHLKSDI